MKDRSGTSSEHLRDNRRVPPAKYGDLTQRDIEAMSAADIHRLVEELQIHQVELVSRNEEARVIQQELEEARDKYTDLFDSAPVGYFTLDHNGILREANLTGVRMLGDQKLHLVGTPLSRFVAPDHMNPFNLHLKRVFAGADTCHSCEIEFARNDGTQWLARLDSVAVAEPNADNLLCRMVISDIADRKLSEDDRSKLLHDTVERAQESKRLSAALIEANSDLLAVNEIHPALFACQTVHQVSVTLTDALVDKFGAYFARVWLVGPGDLCTECALSEHCPAKNRCLHLVASSGHYAHIGGDHRRVPLGSFKIGMIAQGRGKTICNDVINDERVHDREWAAKHDLQSFVGLPLVLNGEVVGVMAMFSKQVLPQHLLDTLDLLAQLGSTALANIEKSQALIDREETFRSISASAQEAIIMIDGDGNITYWNEAATEIFGYTREEVVKTDLHSVGRIVPERFHATHYQAWLELQESGHGAAVGKTTEIVALRKNGEEFPVECALSSVEIKGKWHAIGMIRDITERKTAEDEVRKLSVALEQSPASVVITDTQGTIEYVNPMFTKVTGYTAEEAIGQNPRILKGGSKPVGSYKKLWDTILAGNIWTGAFENQKKNGELYWEEASICPIRDGNGSIKHFLAVKLDITKRKEVEKSLRKTESELRRHRDHLEELVNERTVELARTNDSLVHEVEERKEAERAAEAANSAKGDFLATMSHELRTPLNGVIGMMELLLRSDLNEKQQRHALLAKTSGHTLLALINDILDISKIEAGKLELETTDFDLRHTVESLGVSLASQAEDKGLELICSVHPQVPALVLGDPGRLQQILINLTANAIKFTEHGQVVVRATKEVETERNITIRFTVTDTGIGIPPDRRDRLFRSFSQVDSSTTRKYGGTGLGLAISKQLVERMDGKIGLESEPGRGSTFWFTVKLQRQSVSDLQAPPLRDDLPDVRVLAVDDNATNREILAEQLNSYGLDNENACNGEEALAKLHDATARGTPFGLAILDMQMPGMDGEQLAQLIRSDPSLEDTGLLLLTSDCNGDDTDRLRSLGFSGWLTKPVRQSQLLDAIVDTLACARAVPSNQRKELPVENSDRTPRIQRAKPAGARILLAEDNAINKEAAMELLTLSGYRCEAVENGKDAVRAVLEHDFDVILMDCQMPEMDGFDATRAIRQLEKDGTLLRGDKGKIPIIALTANAIKGDRDRCLESGMDDYLTKPLDPDRLVEVIEIHITRTDDTPHTAPVSISDEPPLKTETVLDSADRSLGDASAPFNLEALFKRWGTNKAFAEKLIVMFCTQAPGDLETLEQALQAGDVEEATRFAHGLKGAASYVSAEAFREVAERLELMGCAGDLSDAEACISELKTELQRCLESGPTQPNAMEPQHANPNC